MNDDASSDPRVLGRYALHGEIASGGMATVHLGQLLGPVGFSRVVAIKRLHPHLAKDPEFVSMFLNEARLAARIQHPNVVSTLDVVALERELLLVLDYVAGETLASLRRAAEKKGHPIPPSIASAIVLGTLYGLHAAHEARSERGDAMGIVHRDVSPQNVMVGTDGVPRVLDFGVAKVMGRGNQTREGVLKGKVSYMPPEQLKGGRIDRRVDIYAASVVLWETLVGAPLFDGENEWQIAHQVTEGLVDPPSRHVLGLPEGLDEVVLQGLARDPSQRYATAIAMAEALERVLPPATAREVGAFVVATAGPSLKRRADAVAEIDSGFGGSEHTVTRAVPAREEAQPRSERPKTNTRAKSNDATAHTRRLREPDDAPTRELPTRDSAPRETPRAGVRAESTQATRLTAPALPEETTVLIVPPPAPSAPIEAIPPTPQPSPRPRWVTVAALVAALIIAFLTGSLASRTKSTDAPVPPPSNAATSLPSASSPPPTPSAPPTASTQALPIASDTTAAPTPSVHPAPAPPAAKPSPVPVRKACNPPWTLDERGIKRLKPECL